MLAGKVPEWWFGLDLDSLIFFGIFGQLIIKIKIKMKVIKLKKIKIKIEKLNKRWKLKKNYSRGPDLKPKMRYFKIPLCRNFV